VNFLGRFVALLGAGLVSNQNSNLRLLGAVLFFAGLELFGRAIKQDTLAEARKP
jgi:hypothetical protein